MSSCTLVNWKLSLYLSLIQKKNKRAQDKIIEEEEEMSGKKIIFF